MSPVALPPGVTIPIELPPFSYYIAEQGDGPRVMQKFVDQADALVAAVDTPYFPVLRKYHFDKINQRLATWPL